MMRSTCSDHASLVTQSNNSGVKMIENGESLKALKYFQCAFGHAKAEYSVIKDHSKGTDEAAQKRERWLKTKHNIRRQQNEQQQLHQQHLQHHCQQQQQGVEQQYQENCHYHGLESRKPSQNIRKLSSDIAQYCLIGHDTTTVNNRSITTEGSGAQLHSTWQKFKSGAACLPIYSRAIRLLPGNTHISSHSELSFTLDPLENSKIHLCVVIFNLGLSYNIQWMEANHYTPPLDSKPSSHNDNKNQQKNLILKAKSMYETSYRLLVDVLQRSNYPINSISTGRNAVIDLLFMALLNNMAQNYLQLKSHYPNERNLNASLEAASRRLGCELLYFAHSAHCYYYNDTNPTIDMYSSPIHTHTKLSQWMDKQIQFFLHNASKAARRGDARNKCNSEILVYGTATGTGAPAA